MEKDKLISEQILKNRIKKTDVSSDAKNRVDDLMKVYNNNTMIDVFTIENDGNVKKDVIFSDIDAMNISKNSNNNDVVKLDK